MRVIELPKPYSWLQWPVTLKGCPKEHLHITAKFFGDAPIDRLAVIGRVPLQQVIWFAEEFVWAPAGFSGQHVLELVKCPEEIWNIHNRFDIIKDQFTPWRPHITVTREYWARVQLEGLTPESECLSIGELELCLGTVNKTATARGKGARHANHN
jgi:hypothetical protein